MKPFQISQMLIPTSKRSLDQGPFTERSPVQSYQNTLSYVLFVTHPITPNEQRRSPFGTIYLIFAIYVETGEYTEHNTQLQMIGEDGLIT